MAVGVAWCAAVRGFEVDPRPVGTNWPDGPNLEPMHGPFQAYFGRRAMATEMGAISISEDGRPCQEVWYFAAGWPRNSMCMVRSRTGLPASPVTHLRDVYSGPSWSGGLQAPEWMVDRQRLAYPRFLPVQPLWGGLATDALLYGAVLAVAWSLLAPLVRRWRRRPWCCAGCGYDRRGLAAGVKCPECGVVPKAGSA